MQRMRDDYPLYDRWDTEKVIGTCTRLKHGRPLNQSPEHFFCENVGKMFLFHYYNCRYIGTEIPGCFHMDSDFTAYSEFKNGFGRNKHKSVIDVLGMTRKFQCYGVEAKASLADYRNGFCACMPYTYIICPKDVIPISELPPKIGLIYVDIPNFHVVGYGDIRGVEVVRGARKRIDSRWLDKDGNFDEERYYRTVDKWYDYIAYRNTVMSVYNRSELPIYKNVYTNKEGSDNNASANEECLDDLL